MSSSSARGLSVAVALADTGLTATVIEHLTRDILARPAVDGRDIALTHRAVAILRALGIWDRFPATHIAPIREARVINGTSPCHLEIRPLAFAANRTGLSGFQSHHP
jgi:2-polyprenyl-6-methoxyphenol hydroxylase-like FAD-dependent oxidoreductase